MPTLDYSGEYITADAHVYSYKISNLEGCLSCEIKVSASTSAGYGTPMVVQAATPDGNYNFFRNKENIKFFIILIYFQYY